MDYEQLRAEATDAVAKSPLNQSELADVLGKSKGAISKALNNAGSRYAALQIQILNHLLPAYDIVILPPRFQALRKDSR